MRKNYLIEYYRNNMTQEQLKDAHTLLNDDNRLLSYICYSYNCYELLHSKGHLSLITNPDALFSTPQAEQQFIMELKNYIRDVIGIKREDVQDGNTKSNRADQNNTKN